MLFSGMTRGKVQKIKEMAMQEFVFRKDANQLQ
jgi:hypothetical protein